MFIGHIFIINNTSKTTNLLLSICNAFYFSLDAIVPLFKILTITSYDQDF